MNNYNELDAARELYEDLVAGKVPTPLDRKEAMDIYKIRQEFGTNSVLTSILDGTITEFYYDGKIENFAGNSMFIYCSNLTTVDLPNVKCISGINAFAGCTALTRINLPSCETLSGGGIFTGASSLEHIELPNLTTIEDTARNLFLSCTALTDVYMPKLEGALPTDAFNNCTSLPSIKIPPLVTHIGDCCFKSTSNLKSVIIVSDTLVTAGKGIFNEGPEVNSAVGSGTGYIYVPKALIEDYKTATNWSAYANQFRALEDYTIDGTVMGELDESKI